MVRVQHAIKKTWDMIAEIVEMKPRQRSYLVRTETGRLYWRNRRFLRRFSESEDKKKVKGDDHPSEPRRSRRRRQAPKRFEYTD